MNTTPDDINNRRTFAIISHPDAGKTTLTEKLLLFGGAIQKAGEVKARGERRRARSDWMKVEQERGISVASSVMTYEYGGYTFNLLDTPGHEDFSEDTYRTLTAVDSVIMVIDGAKGIEAQTKKLFEVCRLRDLPIITYINKLDRDCKDPFELLEDIEQTLALDVSPATWPIGMGRDFVGCYDLIEDRIILFRRMKNMVPESGEYCQGVGDTKLDKIVPANILSQFRSEVEVACGVCPPLELDSYLNGQLTPVYFGSAMHNFGVGELLDGLIKRAPSPRPKETLKRTIDPSEKKVSGFVFKIQANMDPKHRDRIAFFRLVSGKFIRGMKLFHLRSNKFINTHNPILFLASDRKVADEAWAGDIIGIPNHGSLRIGDAISEGENLQFSGIPSFAPELMQKVRPTDPLKAKHLSKALFQLAEEGVASVFKPLIGTDWVVGVVGNLQFDVLADRIRTEYEIPVNFEATELYAARWIFSEDKNMLKKFVNSNRTAISQGYDESLVFLARNNWHLQKTQDDWPDIVFRKIKEQDF
ncbi:MAG: Peptide chain release factor 3 [Alphaproteobacteria bacterium MarineAlpha3_Bin5]|nr:peptide chain release factor 3 [Magnetovibrio sp.]PPR77372.1 MAG: Peptide chain release factor 3 [Alphaproteobacteria bacterium MarineAlpha3_Bin5]